jgi:hypothetical protein
MIFSEWIMNVMGFDQNDKRNTSAQAKEFALAITPAFAAVQRDIFTKQFYTCENFFSLSCEINVRVPLSQAT